jgi:hypothetical protein
MTPAVMASPVISPSLSMECAEALFECRDDLEPLILAAVGLSYPPLSSYLVSFPFDLWSFLPKNLLVEDCRAC